MTENPTTTPINLTHRQEVRVKEFEGKCPSKLTVFTNAGYVRENAPHGATEREILTKIEDSNRRSKESYSPIACIGQACSTISSDYSNKAEAHAAKKAATAAAPEICDGGVVSIDGVLYTTRVIGIGYSDPVHFIPTTTIA